MNTFSWKFLFLKIDSFKYWFRFLEDLMERKNWIIVIRGDDRNFIHEYFTFRKYLWTLKNFEFFKIIFFFKAKRLERFIHGKKSHEILSPEYFKFLFVNKFWTISTNIVEFFRFFFKSFTYKKIYLVNVSVSHSEIIFKLIKHEVKGYIGCIMDGKMCRLLWAEIKSKSLSRPPQTRRWCLPGYFYRAC